jgi:sodium-dependent dicarboxylate transporter 2/3/5
VVALALCVLLNVPGVGLNAEDSPGDIVFGAFSDDTIFLFIGAFILAQAMVTHGLDRRFAFRILSLPGVARSTYGVIIAFGAIAACISAFISNSATCAMLLPIGLGMMGAIGGMVSEQSDTDRDVSRLRFGTALMLMISYASGVGGLLTPIGTPPNLIGIGFIEGRDGRHHQLLRLGDGRRSGLPHHVRGAVRDPDPPKPPRGAPTLRRRGVRERGARQARPVLPR